MTIRNEQQALNVLDDNRNGIQLREEAARFLEQNPTEDATQRLIKALTDDDFGVRWAAATALTRLGNYALTALLHELIQNTSPRLRESAYHVLHYNDSQWIRIHSKPLMDAIKDLAPDVTTPKAAYHLLKEFESRDHHGDHDESSPDTPSAGSGVYTNV
jgi:hypothetical protein